MYHSPKFLSCPRRRLGFVFILFITCSLFFVIFTPLRVQASSTSTPIEGVQSIETLVNVNGEIDIVPALVSYSDSVALTNEGYGATVDTSVSGVSGLLCTLLTCSLSGSANLVDSTLNNSAHLVLIANSIGTVAISLTQVLSAGHEVGFVLDTGALLSVNLLNDTTIQTYKSGVLQEEVSGSTLLNVNLGAGTQYEVGFVTTRDFDEVQLSVSSLVALGLDVYHAYVQIPTVTHALDFGNQTINVSSLTQVITLTNAGIGVLDLNNISLLGENLADFAITSNNCGTNFPVALNALDTCIIELSFVPDSAGAKIARLAILSNDNDEPLLEVNLTGIGLSTPDITAPIAPLIISPISGVTLATALPLLVGTAEANSTVKVYADGSTLICTVTVNAIGNFSCAASLGLSEGAHALTVTATDAANNVSDPSIAVNITIDTVKPLPPIITKPLSNTATSTQTPLIQGTAEAGVTVTVKESSSILCTTTADPSGVWSCMSTALSNASHTINATATDKAGNTNQSASTSFEVDATLTTSILLPTAGALISDSMPIFSGQSTPFADIQVSEGAQVLCATVADSSGNWSCKSTVSLSEEIHSVVAIGSDSGGGVKISPAHSFTVDVTLPSTPVLLSLGNGSVIITTTPAFTGTKDSDVVVVAIEAGSTLCSDTVTQSENWSCTSSLLSSGLHTVTFESVDMAGNHSLPLIVSFTVHASSQGDIDNDGILDDEEGTLDSDGDGVPDSLEPNNVDTDNDGIPNHLDDDDDGDGIKTNYELDKDSDSDQVPDYLDRDDDGDGIFTDLENADPNHDGNPADAIDSDGDKVPDYLDPIDNREGTSISILYLPVINR